MFKYVYQEYLYYQKKFAEQQLNITQFEIRLWLANEIKLSLKN
jgi:hypothetical protein